MERLKWYNDFDSILFLWCLCLDIQYFDSISNTLDNLKKMKMYSRHKLLLNFQKFLLGIDLSAINPIPTKSPFMNCIDKYCCDNEFSPLILHKFISVITAFCLYADLFNEWNRNSINISSVLCYELSGLMKRTSGLFKIIISSLISLCAITISLGNLIFHLKLNDEDYHWYILRYYCVINYARFCDCFDLILVSSQMQVYSFRSLVLKIENISPGPYIHIDNALILRIGLLSYLANDPIFFPINIEFHGDDIVHDVINNSFYSHKVFLNSHSLIIGSYAQFISGFLNTQTDAAHILISALNFLNSIEYCINSQYFYFIQNLLINSPLIFQSFFFGSNINTASLDMTKKNFIKVSLSEINSLLNFQNSFYIQHCIDSRCRIYALPIPINYQLSRFVRSLLIFKKKNTVAIYLQFLKEYNFSSVWSHTRFFYNQWISYDVLTEINLSLSINNMIFTNFEDVEKNIKEFIYSEAVYTVLYRIGFKSGFDVNRSILNGLDIFNKIKFLSIDDSIALLASNSKKIFDTSLLVWSLKEWWKDIYNLPSLTWYNDASSNVLQLLFFKLFVNDPFLLEVANIQNNHTQYKDIYHYIEECLKKEFPNWSDMITRDLIKLKLMPGTYGQTHLRFIKESEKILADNSHWILFDSNEKQEFLKIITDRTWGIFKDKGIPLQDFLKLCQYLSKERPEHCRWFNKFDFPIIIEKKYNLRTTVRQQIKKLYVTLKNTTDFTIKENLELRLKQLNKKVLASEKKYIRQKFSLRASNSLMHIKIRFKKKDDTIDFFALSNGIAASSNHSDDAHILIQSLLDIKKMNIPVSVIHDSIGSLLEFSPIIKYIFKVNNIKFIDRLLQHNDFPFSILEYKFKTYNRELLRSSFINNRSCNKVLFLQQYSFFKSELIQSVNFFN